MKRAKRQKNKLFTYIFVMRPTLEYIVLNRLGYGHSPKSLKAIQQLGVTKYLEEQLNPQSKDEEADAAILAAQLEINYNNKGTKVKELRPLSLLNKKISDLWAIRIANKAHAEKIRPAQEVAFATILRAQHSRWQLREILADFWHNHFNINAFGDDKIAVLFPSYDRDVIRKHIFGNFRTFLEAVAQSPCMLFYLDNAKSKASPANENYARELFELHTFGAPNYLNNLYDQWRDVPKDKDGNVKGYIDEDVYEAARAFTGWTVADGSHDGKGSNLPNTGEFHYLEAWHDQYQKRVLGIEFPHHQPALADGQKVLDILAAHSATARYVCRKLCQRLVADNPPNSLVDKAVAAWIQHQKSEQQLRQVVRVIITSPEFSDTYGQKTKTPLELVVSLTRAADTPIQPNQHLYYMLQNMGQQLFSWATPTGHPDDSKFWLNTNMLLSRWNAVATLLQEDWHSICSVDVATWLGDKRKSSYQLAQDWIIRILGTPTDEKTTNTLAAFLAQGGSTDEPPMFNNERDARWHLANALTLVAQLPDFQKK
jgi:uncharacterized protein (DUF1800 family)